MLRCVRRRRVIAALYTLRLEPLRVANNTCRCYLYAARHLPFPACASDKPTYPSPFVRVTCGGATTVSSTASKTRFPIYLEVLQLDCRLLVSRHDNPPFNRPDRSSMLMKEYQLCAPSYWKSIQQIAMARLLLWSGSCQHSTEYLAGKK